MLLLIPSSFDTINTYKNESVHDLTKLHITIAFSRNNHYNDLMCSLNLVNLSTRILNNSTQMSTFCELHYRSKLFSFLLDWSRSQKPLH